MKKIFYSLIACALVACNAETQTGSEPIRAEIATADEVKIPKVEDGFKAYETEETWIMYPEDWTIDTADADGINFFIYSPLVEKDDLFQENINLATEKLPNNSITTAYYIDRALEMIKTSFTDLQLIENKEHKGNFGTYRTIIYTASMSGMRLKWKQSVYIKDATAYIVSFTALEETFKSFDEISDKAMKSFIVK